MKKVFILLAVLIGFLLNTSCKKEINITLKSSAVRLVVDGLITDEGKSHIVKITQSSNYFNNDPEPEVSGAIVSISDGNMITSLTETEPGVYETPSDFKGEIGKTYSLDIKYNKEEYSGSSLIKPVMTVDSIYFQKIQNENPNDPQRYRVLINAQELPEQGDCYAFYYYKNGVFMSDTLNRANIINDDFSNGIYLIGFRALNVTASPGDTITLEIRSITRQYFDYLKLIMAQTRTPNTPFTGPPANVEGNMKDITDKSKQVMGYFTASAVYRKTAIIM